MLINRQVVSKKIKEYLNSELSKQDVYEWAKEIVVSSEYEKISKTDKLLGDAIQVLWELHHADGKFDPPRKEIAYYLRLLKVRGTVDNDDSPPMPEEEKTRRGQRGRVGREEEKTRRGQGTEKGQGK